MNNIHIQPAFLKELSLIPLMSYCNSKVNGHLVVLEETVFCLINELNQYPETGNLALKPYYVYDVIRKDRCRFHLVIIRDSYTLH